MTDVIERIEVLPIKIPTRIPIKLANATHYSQENVIVRVWSGGDYGLGETEPFLGFEGCGETQNSIVYMIRDVLAPAIIGTGLFDIGLIGRKLDELSDDQPYARNGLVNAIYDLMARKRKMPLWKFLGGAFREKLPVVWTIGIREDSAEMAEQAKEAVSRGYRLLKLKIGGRPIEKDIENVSRIRAAVGDGIGIRLDANGGLSLDDAREIFTRLKALRIDLVEQPLIMADIGGMAKLVAERVIPVMPDEGLTSIASARRISLKAAATIFGMKLAKHGGVDNGLRIVKIAREIGVPIYPGNQPSTSIGSANAAHFFASIDIATLGGDFHVGPAGWLADDIVVSPLRVEGGFAYVPQGLGIGMELDEAKISTYLV